MYAVVASASGSSSWNKWKWREPISSTSPSGGTKPSTVSSDSLRNDGRKHVLNKKVATARTSATTAATAVALTATLGLAAASWVFAAAVFVIAAGVYELTPLKQHFRRRCRESAGSGFAFGLCCVGSSIGLMVMLVALSVMSVTFMFVIAALVVAHKLLPAKAAIDVPVALAIVGLGLLIVIAPSSVPGLTPPMSYVIDGAAHFNPL